ncbi:hypothetical protein LuPra_02312 [Luteitalea pratensis]|uniref:Uncharacterized protein n=1 Tax=Luteitalea pratensis TaxID=1855912 RepID=A0A143PKR9_LUTPR|nr:hypothetical protein [Luteitalea pratensis]AMY09101.1 hypothetical protein LuPra_02312 [Luteitalea pratensis]
MLRYVTLVTCLSTTAVLAAQGVKETVRLTVTSAEAASPLVITAGPVIERANVFVGAFIGEPTGPPDPSYRRYRLSFDVQGMDAIKYEAYVVLYAKGELDDGGYVYLPGPGAPEYRRNISTIMRDGHDGAWHRAEAAWARALNATLP